MNDTVVETGRAKQRADGAVTTLTPTDRKVLILAIDAYKMDLSRKANKIKGKQPEIWDLYMKLIAEADRTLKNIS